MALYINLTKVFFLLYNINMCFKKLNFYIPRNWRAFQSGDPIYPVYRLNKVLVKKGIDALIFIKKWVQ
jgi:hypothetical protein